MSKAQPPDLKALLIAALDADMQSSRQEIEAKRAALDAKEKRNELSYGYGLIQIEKASLKDTLIILAHHILGKKEE